MREAISSQIQHAENKINEYSNLIGEKIRTGQESHEQDPEFNELKEKIQGENNQDKKKKKKHRKQKNESWFELDGIQIYHEMGLKGELELYFKASELLKEHLENLHKIKKAVDDIIDKGLKDDMGCVVLQGFNLPYQISFQKSGVQRKKFSFKTTIKAMSEVMEVPSIS